MSPMLVSMTEQLAEWQEAKSPAKDAHGMLPVLVSTKQ